jgi:hypothetical protein
LALRHTADPTPHPLTSSTQPIKADVKRRGGNLDALIQNDRNKVFETLHRRAAPMANNRHSN